ncbi:MAG: fatty acid desaturase [Lysobacter sp.]|nr:fatty acid desaturase [Lysobacter sp.]
MDAALAMDVHGQRVRVDVLPPWLLLLKAARRKDRILVGDAAWRGDRGGDGGDGLDAAFSAPVPHTHARVAVLPGDHLRLPAALSAYLNGCAEQVSRDQQPHRTGLDWIFAPLCVGQNYHLSHHLYPGAPFYR